eukprot:gene7070-48274_t
MVLGVVEAQDIVAAALPQRTGAGGSYADTYPSEAAEIRLGLSTTMSGLLQAGSAAAQRGVRDAEGDMWCASPGSGAAESNNSSTAQVSIDMTGGPLAPVAVFDAGGALTLSGSARGLEEGEEEKQAEPHAVAGVASLFA